MAIVQAKTGNSYDVLSGSDPQYDVGDIKITSTNTNPSSKYGGTWELINKEFKITNIYIDEEDDKSEYFTPIDGELKTISFQRNNSNLAIRLLLDTASTINDTKKDIGTLNISKLGVTSLIGSRYVAGIGNAINGIVNTTVNTQGGVDAVDCIPKGSGTTLPGGDWYVQLDYILLPEYMIDSFCDKFYWRKTA